MTIFMRHASIVSTIALLTVGTAGLASAQTKTYGDQNNNCVEGQDNCPPPEMQKSDEGNQTASKKRRIQQNEDETNVEQPDQPRKVRQARSDWKFDSKHQERITQTVRFSR